MPGGSLSHDLIPPVLQHLFRLAVQEQSAAVVPPIRVYGKPVGLPQATPEVEAVLSDPGPPALLVELRHIANVLAQAYCNPGASVIQICGYQA